MNIIIISSYLNYGSGVIAREFRDMLANSGNAVAIVTNTINVGEEGVFSISNSLYSKMLIAAKKTIFWKAKRFFLRLIGINIYHRPKQNSTPLADEKLSKKTVKQVIDIMPFNPDVVILFFTMGFLSFYDIAELQKRLNVPFYWIMPDVGALTGGCYYPYDCTNYQKNCCDCPLVKRAIDKRRIYKNCLKINEVISNMDITLLGNTWQQNKIIETPRYINKRKEFILAPIDASIFRRIDKATAKELMKLPNDKFILFCGANSMTDPRKGGHELVKVLEILQDKMGDRVANVELLVVGANSSIFGNLKMMTRTKERMPYDQLYLAYCAADLFLCPSIEDAGPTMINQSIACGTPVVAFEMGVALDIVQQGVTGYKAKIGDEADFAKGILSIYDLPSLAYQNLSDSCFEYYKDNFSREIFTIQINSIIDSQINQII